MQIRKSSVYLFFLGVFLLAFSQFAFSANSLSHLNDSLRQGREASQDILFWLSGLRSTGLRLGAMLCAIAAIDVFAGNALRAFLNGGSAEQSPASVSTASRFLDLFLISALSLFAELLIIRWLSVEMRVFAYFKNVPLISCFLGIGLGAALGDTSKKMRFQSFPFWFSLFAVVVVFLGPRLIFVNPAGSDEFIWGIGKTSSLATQWMGALFFFTTILFVFVWNTRLFMTIGYLTGRMLEGLKPLTAYSINIAGSLAGVLFFTVISFFSWPPVVWFAIALGLFLFFLRDNLRYFIAMLAVSLVFLVYLGTVHEPNQTFWSPYYKISLKPAYIQSVSTKEKVLAGYALHVNEDSHQTGMNYSDAFLSKHVEGGKRYLQSFLELPFRIRPVKNALIVGSGMGNDVAAALRAGAEHVDAVEIDPMIIKIGKKFHPEHPYDSSRVTVINDDARSYFKKTKKKYDVVVFGILDSHTQFSSLSNLRLDNYVYTIESFRDAKALLNPGGFISLTFAGDAKVLWMGARFNRMLAEVFGREPIAFDLSRLMFVVGDTLDEKILTDNPYWKEFHEKRISFEAKEVRISTDDWPFIYMRTNQVPAMYLGMIALLCLIAWVFLKRYLQGQSHLDMHFFLLGAAFLLLETKAVSELALVFGTTWIVNAIVFSGIMVLILIGNWIVQKGILKNPAPVYWMLTASLLISYLVPLNWIAGYDFGIKILLSLLIVLLPLFFASMIFAMSFAGAAHLPSAFGSNLLGAVVGGFFEYASLATGTRFLALLALAFYWASYAALKKKWSVAL